MINDSIRNLNLLINAKKSSELSCEPTTHQEHVSNVRDRANLYVNAYTASSLHVISCKTPTCKGFL